jgi:hypothetical protein
MPRIISLITLIMSLVPGLLTNVLWAADSDLGVEFSAESVSHGPEEQSMSSKMFVGKNGTRKEFSHEGKRVIEIVNPSKHVTWMLFPDKKTYLERRLGPPPGSKPAAKPDAANPCAGAPESVSCRKLGVERVNGREAVKWEIVSSRQGRTMRTMQWIDQERGIPIKQEFPGGSSEYRMIGEETVNGRKTEKWEYVQYRQKDDKTTRTLQWYDPILKMPIREEMPGGYSRELRNIQVGPQPASLFELPQGYEKKEMPRQGRGGGRESRQ